MIRLLAAVFLVLVPAQLIARTVAVKSGEHADFSRLVVLFGNAPEWEFGRVEGGYELRFADTDAEIDLSTVFDLIPRDRIADAQVRDGGSVFLSVNCDCHAEAFAISVGLVIDIKDGSAGANARFEASLPTRGAGLPATAATDIVPDRTRPDTVAVSTVSAVGPGDLTKHFRVPRTALVWQTEISPDLGTASNNADTEPAPVERHDAAPDVRAAEMQQQLLAQLSRAAVQGLVTPDLPPVGMPAGGQAPHAAPSVPPGPEHDGNTRPAMSDDAPDPHGDSADTAADNTVSEPGPGAGHIRVETALDRGIRDDPVLSPITPEGANCLPDAQFAVAQWGTATAPGNPLAPQRSGLVGEFDKSDRQGVEALARNYVYLTFGAEVRALLRTFGEEVPDRELLLSLAEIMDEGFSTRLLPGRTQAACDAKVALWAVLATRDLSATDPVADQAVLAAFMELPLHLRRHLGPVLTERFLAIGDPDTAAAIRASIARAPGGDGEGLAMMTARIAVDAHGAAAGAGDLREIVQKDGPLAPDAVIHLIDTSLSDGVPVGDDMIDIAASYAFEAQGSGSGAELSRVHLRALAHAGRVLAALDGLNRATDAGQLDAGTVITLRREIYALATRGDDDAVFLQLALARPADIGDNAEAAALRRDIAARLVTLGLGGEARAYLADSNTLPSPEARVIIARSHLADGQYELASGYLAGLTGDDAAQMGAEVLAQAGAHSDAATRFEQLGDHDAQSRANWRAMNWAAVAETGTPQERAAARLVLASGPGDAEGLTPLARDRALIDRSRDARQVLSALLNSSGAP